MTISLTTAAPASHYTVGAEESRPTPRAVLAERREASESRNLACRDVIDEVRRRMTLLGYRWD